MKRSHDEALPDLVNTPIFGRLVSDPVGGSDEQPALKKHISALNAPLYTPNMPFLVPSSSSLTSPLPHTFPYTPSAFYPPHPSHLPFASPSLTTSNSSSSPTPSASTSTPSASSSTSSSTPAPPSRRSDYSLQLEPHARYPFINVWYKLNLHVVTRYGPGKKTEVQNRLSFPVTMQVYLDNGDRVTHNLSDLIEVSLAASAAEASTRATIPANASLDDPGFNLPLTHGSISFHVRFKKSCSVLHNRNVVFRFLPGSMETIEPEKSRNMTPVRFRLKIHAQPPSVWYKDEGGQNKSLDISGYLVDEHNHVVRNKEFPLRVSLLYEGEQAVKSEKVLKLLHNGRRPVVTKDGRFDIKFRIEEVSKNHQKQNFCVRVDADSPDSSSHAQTLAFLSDIAGDVSEVIEVKSKRNKKSASMTKDERPPSPLPPPTVVSAASHISVPGLSAGFGSNSTADVALETLSAAAALSSEVDEATDEDDSSDEEQDTRSSSSSSANSSSALFPFEPHSSSSSPTFSVGVHATTAFQPVASNSVLISECQSELSQLKNSLPSDIHEQSPMHHVSKIVEFLSINAQLLADVEWSIIGYEFSSVPNFGMQIEPQRAIRRCNVCLAQRDSRNPNTPHRDDCKFARLSIEMKSQTLPSIFQLLQALGFSAPSSSSASSISSSSPDSINNSSSSSSNPLPSAPLLWSRMDSLPFMPSSNSIQLSRNNSLNFLSNPPFNPSLISAPSTAGSSFASSASSSSLTSPANLSFMVPSLRSVQNIPRSNSSFDSALGSFAPIPSSNPSFIRGASLPFDPSNMNLGLITPQAASSDAAMSDFPADDNKTPSTGELTK